MNETPLPDHPGLVNSTISPARQGRSYKEALKAKRRDRAIDRRLTRQLIAETCKELLERFPHLTPSRAKAIAKQAWKDSKDGPRTIASD